MPPDDIKSSNEEGVYLYNGCSPGKGYSVGYSLSNLIKEKEPESFSDLIDQIIQVSLKLGKEFTGPIAFNSLDLYSSLFVTENGDSDDLHNILKNFIHQVNKLDLDLSISLDLLPPDDLLDEFTGCQNRLDQFNNVLCAVLHDSYNNGFFKPSLILNIHNGEIWSKPILDQYLTISYMYGSPLIQNKISSTITYEPTRPSNRTFDREVLYQRIGGPTGNADDTGVLGYVCINLAKIGFDAESEEEFFRMLDDQMDEASEILENHRANLISTMNVDSHPCLTKIDDLDWMYSSIVLTGMNEALEYLIAAPLGHVAGKAVSYKVLEFIRIKMEEIQSEGESLYILESMPSEKYNDQILEQSGLPNAFLTRGTELPAYHGDDLWDALEHQKKLQVLYTGSSLVEIHLKKGLTYHNGCLLLTRRIIEQFGFSYLAVTPSEVIQSSGVKKIIRVDGNINDLDSLSENYKEVHGKRVHYDVKNR